MEIIIPISHGPLRDRTKYIRHVQTKGMHNALVGSSNIGSSNTLSEVPRAGPCLDVLPFCLCCQHPNAAEHIRLILHYTDGECMPYEGSGKYHLADSDFGWGFRKSSKEAKVYSRLGTFKQWGACIAWCFSKFIYTEGRLEKGAHCGSERSSNQSFESWKGDICNFF